MEMLISVIVPVYNVRDYIEKCVQSIINQTYKNLEIILVDDGSTDGSGEICDELKAIDDRIVVLHKNNGGLSDARNFGIDYAHGDYLSFIDSDDYIHPDMYASMLRRMIFDNSDLCICNYIKVDELGEKVTGKYSNFDIRESVISSKDMIKGLESPNVVYFVVAWNKLYKRKIFDNLRYPVGKVHEDEYIAHIVAHCVKNVSCMTEVYYFYLQRKGSIMHGDTSRSRRDKIEAYTERFDYITKRYVGLQNELIWLLADYISNLANEYIYCKNKDYFLQHTQMYNERFIYVIKENFGRCKISSRMIKCLLFFVFPNLYCKIKAYQAE